MSENTLQRRINIAKDRRTVQQALITITMNDEGDIDSVLLESKDLESIYITKFNFVGLFSALKTLREQLEKYGWKLLINAARKGVHPLYGGVKLFFLKDIKDIKEGKLNIVPDLFNLSVHMLDPAPYEDIVTVKEQEKYNLYYDYGGKGGYEKEQNIDKVYWLADKYINTRLIESQGTIKDDWHGDKEGFANAISQIILNNEQIDKQDLFQNLNEGIIAGLINTINEHPYEEEVSGEDVQLILDLAHQSQDVYTHFLFSKAIKRLIDNNLPDIQQGQKLKEILVNYNDFLLTKKKDFEQHRQLFENLLSASLRSSLDLIDKYLS